MFPLPGAILNRVKEKLHRLFAVFLEGRGTPFPASRTALHGWNPESGASAHNPKLQSQLGKFRATIQVATSMPQCLPSGHGKKQATVDILMTRCTL